MTNLYSNIARIVQREAMVNCLAMVSSLFAKRLSLKDYGIKKGTFTDLVMIDSTKAVMPLDELVKPMFGFKRGKLIRTHSLPEPHEH
jgi:hypothetical protein